MAHEPIDNTESKAWKLGFLVQFLLFTRQTSKPQNVIDSQMVIVGQGVHLWDVTLWIGICLPLELDGGNERGKRGGAREDK